MVQIPATVGILVWIFADAQLLRKIGQTLLGADPWWLLAGVAMGGASVAIMASRWLIFLRTQGIRLPYRRALAIYLISLFFTLFLPGAVSSGAARGLYLFYEHPGRKTAVVLSIIADHLSGLIALVLVAIVFTFSRARWFDQAPIPQGTLYVLAAFLGLTMTGLLLTMLGVQSGFIDTMPHQVPFRAKMVEFAKALNGVLMQWRVMLKGIGVSLLVLLTFFLTFDFAARAFDAGVSTLDMLSIMPIVDVITALPLTASGIGVREKLFEELLTSLAGVPADVALLVSMTGFAFSAVWSVLGGPVFAVYAPRRGQHRVNPLQDDVPGE